MGLPRCKNLTRFSLFASFCFAVRYCFKCFCFLCFTSSVGKRNFAFGPPTLAEVFGMRCTWRQDFWISGGNKLYFSVCVANWQIVLCPYKLLNEIEWIPELMERSSRLIMVTVFRGATWKAAKHGNIPCQVSQNFCFFRRPVKIEYKVDLKSAFPICRANAQPLVSG